MLVKISLLVCPILIKTGITESSEALEEVKAV